MLLKVQIQKLEQSLDLFTAIHNFRVNSRPMQRARLAHDRGHRCLRKAKEYYGQMEVAIEELNTNPNGENSGRHSVLYGEARIQVRSWLSSGDVAIQDCTYLCELALKEMEERNQVDQGVENTDVCSSGDEHEEEFSEDDATLDADTVAVSESSLDCDTQANDNIGEDGEAVVEDNGS